MLVEVIDLGYVLDGDHGQYKCTAVGWAEEPGNRQAFRNVWTTDSLTVAVQ